MNKELIQTLIREVQLQGMIGCIIYGFMTIVLYIPVIIVLLKIIKNERPIYYDMFFVKLYGSLIFMLLGIIPIICFIQHANMIASPTPEAIRISADLEKYFVIKECEDESE